MNAAGPDELPRDAGPMPLPSPLPGVDVWMCGLARAPDEVRALAASLSAAEAARTARFGRDDLRERYVVGRATLRALLGARLGCAPAEVVIGRGERGRPYAVDAGGLDFNVSHTAGVALIAVANDVRIGVDIERGDRQLNVDGVARKFMAPDEQRRLGALAQDARRRALLRLWTCKEAMSKATGDALAAPFRRMSVAIDGGLRLANGPAPYRPDAWRLEAVAAPGAFLATVALWHRD
ncbi:MAG: 4'-phosphopantetheinyl transferase superfamily protein [Betaproteobacteria bacterium]|nr:4'-phosphopantetheinyl transferase superfamily protein [Betaproteobacteria bacterium]MCC7217485.1 4'-phosphopantetheinyl transferase superfamily protein [Burkholderiales bacterium]